MIYPRFMADSFWNFSEACELVGARYPAIPLGLITVAALLPKSWNVRLVNRNTEELAESDLDWADMVMTGGMLFQQADTLDLIEMCRARRLAGRGRRPGRRPRARTATQRANFRVLGEAEGIIDNSSRPGTRASARAPSKRRNSRSTSPRRRCRASIC